MSWIDWNPNVPRKICMVCGAWTDEGAAPLGIVSGMLPCHLSHSDADVTEAYFRLMREHGALPDLDAEENN